MKDFNIERYEAQDFKKNDQLIQKVGKLIESSFEDIKDYYTSNSTFFSFVEDIYKNLEWLEDDDVIYLLKNSKEDLIWCLLGKEKFKELNKKMWKGNLFFSTYLWIDKEYRRKWYWSILKKFFEDQALYKSVDTQAPSLVISRVNKKNIWSITWNQSNDYQEWDEWEKSDFIQFYKEFYPNT